MQQKSLVSHFSSIFAVDLKRSVMSYSSNNRDGLLSQPVNEKKLSVERALLEKSFSPLSSSKRFGTAAEAFNAHYNAIETGKDTNSE